MHLIELEGDAVSINGRNVLAWPAGMEADVHLAGGAGVAAGGLFNSIISGTAWSPSRPRAPPVVLATDAPTFVDSNAVVCWSANLQTQTASSFTMGNLIGRGSGEAIQIGFSGQGRVIVQPPEFDLATMNQSGQNTGPPSGAGGGLGGLAGGLLGR